MQCSTVSTEQSTTTPVAQKYLFLDFDGPLHPSTTLQGKNVALLASSPTGLRAAGFFIWAELLEGVLRQAEAAHPGGLRIHVIVHSSWRAQPWFSTPVIRQALGCLGQRICGFTRSELPRAEAVAELCARMDIEDFLVLDDDVAAFQEHPGINSRLVPVSPLHGVRDANVQAALLEWATLPTVCPTGEPSPALA